MLNRPFSILFTLLALVLLFNLHPVSAKNDSNNRPDFVPPETEGTYDVPGHPNMKVRVFVYRAKGKGGGKPGKPTPTPTPVTGSICGLSDPELGPVDGTTGWHLPSSWVYNLNLASVPSSVGSSNLDAIADNSFSAWTEAIPGTMSIDKGADTGTTRSSFDGQNIIAWGRTSRSALAVTYTWYYTDTKAVVDVDTIMNNSYPWSWSGSATCAYPNSYDAQNILTHELGHWFGMDDMYSGDYIHNTMFGYGSTKEAKKNTLTTGDKLGVSSIYPL